MSEKQCSGCERLLLISCFNVNARNRDGRDHRCRDCRRDARKKQAVPGAGQNRRWALSKRYGMTPEDYDHMVAEQHGVCAICQGPPERKIAGGHPPRLVIDHNHTTGKVRGLLCFDCNVKLATIEDEQFTMLARRYLTDRDDFDFVERAHG